MASRTSHLEVMASYSFVDVPTLLRDGVGPLPRYVGALFRHELAAERTLGEIVLTPYEAPPKSEALVAHVPEPVNLGFFEWYDRKRERRGAVRFLHRMGYVVRNDKIYHPEEIRIEGKLVERNEKLVGRLLFDGFSNRAEILWEHCYKVERGLRETGYVSVAPLDKI